MIRLFGWSVNGGVEMPDRAVDASLRRAPNGNAIDLVRLNARRGLRRDLCSTIPPGEGAHLKLSLSSVRRVEWTLGGPTVLSVECTGKDDRDEVIAELADTLERYMTDVVADDVPAMDLVVRARGLVR